MSLTPADVLTRLDAVIPDVLVHKRTAKLGSDRSSNERLAQVDANVAVSLHDPISPDGANLERIAVNLENATHHFAAASGRPRRSAEVP